MKSNIFTKEPVVSRNSWHYKLHRLYSKSDYHLPRTQCSYFWITILRLSTILLWLPGRIFFDDEVYDAMDAVEWTGKLYLLCYVGFASTLSMIWLLFSRNPVSSFGNIFVELSVILGIVFMGIITFSLIAGMSIGIWQDNIYPKFKEWKNRGTEKAEEDEVEETYTLWDSFKGWMSDKKNKVCKPVTYK